MTARIPGPSPLPIDAALPAIVDAVRSCGAVVVEAPPGAGKTTRVPRALLDAGMADAGEVWVLEPRRLPVRLAAARVAAELGERAGETIGYAVRFEEVAGPKTRVRFMTEGLFVRRLLARPDLGGVSAVIVDELHERHVATDLALAWLAHLRAGGAGAAPKVIAMSATMDAEPVRALLAGEAGRAEVVRSEGRLYDVAVEHLPQPDDRPLDRQVVGAVRRLLREEATGDVLVFLPGAADIRRAQAALSEIPEAATLTVLPLHGEMPLEEQARAVRPAGDGRRKVVLATNVAESSITIDGVVGVVDAGLARVAAHSPWTGLPTLATAKISQAAAVQRAGRAGRTRPGRALRLYTRHDFEQRRAHELPEIARADLADLALTLAALGIDDADALAWMEAPPAGAWGAARALLAALGAVEGGGRITERGRRMARLGVHPRLARLVVEGGERGAADAAALAAALISERDIRSAARAQFRGGPRVGAPNGPRESGAELGDLVDVFREAEEQRFRPEALRRLELDARAVEEVARVRDQLVDRPRAGPRPRRPDDVAAELRALRLSVLAAFPDRVARRRDPRATTVLLSGGGAAELGFVHAPGEWMVAVDVQEVKAARPGARAGVQVRLASAMEPDWLIDLFPERIEEIDRRAFNPETARVERATGLRYGALALDETIEPAPRDEETARLLADAALARGLERLPGGDELPALLARLAFARDAAPESPWPTLGANDLAGLIRVACVGRVSFAELGDGAGGIGALVLAALAPEARHALQAVAPERVTLPGGRSVRVRYDDVSGGPWIESRLQDFFGMSATPRVGGGRIPLTVHLLAPNGRAVQVTRDLAGFWTQHYPPLRRELGRRYPKHAWPEDGATARPPPPAPPRRRP